MIQRLRLLPYFFTLSAEHLTRLADLCTVIRKEPNELIFSEGEPSQGFYAICSGKVNIYKLSNEGREVSLHVFGAGEIFAEVPVFNNLKVYPANAMALEQTELIRVDGEGFLALVHEHPEILLSMMTVFAKRLHHFSRTIEDLSLRNVESRLAKYLLEVSLHSQQLTLDVNKKTLAAILATVPETLSRSFQKLGKQGLITVNESAVSIDNREGLVELAMLS